MNKFTGLSTAALLTAAMSSTALATGDEAETIIKDNNTAIAGAQNNTNVQTGAVAGAQSYSQGGNGGNAYSAGGQGGQGGQGGAAEQEQDQAQGQFQGQGQGQGQEQTANATGGTAEQEQSSNNENNNSNSGNNQTSSYSSNYEAAASSAYAHAPTAIASSKCGSADSFGFGIQFLAGGASISNGESTPAGVQLRYTNDDGEAAVASLESYVHGTPTFKADVSEDLTKNERATLSCLEEEFNNREDVQQHTKEMRVIDMHANVVEAKARHVCRDDAKHYGSHDCIKMGDTSLDFLNQMIGFKPEPAVQEASAPVAVQPAHNHNHN